MKTSDIQNRVDLKIQEVVASNYHPDCIVISKCPLADIPFSKYPTMLEMYCQGLAKVSPQDRHAKAGGCIVGTFFGDVREQLVRRGTLGVCFDIVDKVLGIDMSVSWEVVPYTSIQRMRNNKTGIIDLRGLGQIYRDAPSLFADAITPKEDARSTTAHTLVSCLISILREDTIKKKSILSKGAATDFSYTLVGCMEQFRDNISHKMVSSALVATYLDQWGVKLPELGVDPAWLEISNFSSLQKGFPSFPKGILALRRASLAYQARQNKNPEGDMPFFRPKM